MKMFIYAYRRFNALPTGCKLTLIFVLAFAVRLLMNIVFQGLSSPQKNSVGTDPIEYDLMAQNFVLGKGFSLGHGPTTYRAPGVSFFLVPIYYLFGVNYVIVRIMFCLLGAWTCVINYFIGRKILNEKLGILASALLAIYPMHFYYSMHFVSEIPYAFLMSLAVWSFLLFEEKDKTIFGILAGSLIGLSAYVRPQAIFYLPFYVILCFMAFFYKNKIKCIRLAFIPLIVAVLTIVPWIIRNYKLTNHFIFINTIGGQTFWGAHNEIILKDPKSMGSFAGPMRLPEWPEFKNFKTRHEKNRAAYGYGFRFVKNHLKDMPKIEMMKLYRLFTPFYGTRNKMFNIIGGTGWGIISVFVFIGITATLKNKMFISLHSALLSTLFIALVFFGHHRFRESISPFLAIYASIGWFYFARLIGWLTNGYGGAR